LVLQKLIEQVDVVQMSGPAILSAIQLLLKLESGKHGEKNAPVTDVRELPKHTPSAAVENIADGGSLPEPLSWAEAATPDDSQDGEEDAQVTETNRVQEQAGCNRPELNRRWRTGIRARCRGE
jgi:hypothetical protein